MTEFERNVSDWVPDGPDHEVGQLLLLLHRDAHAAVHLLTILGRRPVLHAHHPETKQTVQQLYRVQCTSWRLLHAQYSEIQNKLSAIVKSKSYRLDSTARTSP